LVFLDPGSCVKKNIFGGLTIFAYSREKWAKKIRQIELTLVFPQGVVLRQKLVPAVVTPMRLSD
jgi:hypothetical protein